MKKSCPTWVSQQDPKHFNNSKHRTKRWLDDYDFFIAFLKAPSRVKAKASVRTHFAQAFAYRCLGKEWSRCAIFNAERRAVICGKLRHTCGSPQSLRHQVLWKMLRRVPLILEGPCTRCPQRSIALGHVVFHDFVTIWRQYQSPSTFAFFRQTYSQVTFGILHLPIQHFHETQYPRQCTPLLLATPLFDFGSLFHF